MYNYSYFLVCKKVIPTLKEIFLYLKRISSNYVAEDKNSVPLLEEGFYYYNFYYYLYLPESINIFQYFPFRLHYKWINHQYDIKIWD